MDLQKRAITLGNFDGVHIGHRALLEKTISIAQKEKIPSLAVTYHPNPALVLGKKGDFQYLQTLEERKQEILKYGIQEVHVLEFNLELANMEAEEFIEKIILDTFHASHIVIGYNHCFGRNRRGNYQLLQELAPKYNFQVYLVDPVSLEGVNISSSLIRNWIKEGKLPEARRALGRFYSISGEVVEGAKVGGSIGYPTANLAIPNDIVLPSSGVYASITNGMESVTNIGPRPTFGDNRIHIESHILDWNGNLYGSSIKVELVQKLRNTISFRNPNDLIHQIQKDIEQTKKILKNSLKSMQT